MRAPIAASENDPCWKVRLIRYLSFFIRTIANSISFNCLPFLPLGETTDIQMFG